MKTILITGSSGFIGSKLCAQLSAAYNVIGFDRATQNDMTNETYTKISGDITNEAKIKKICSQYCPDIIIHCAGIAHQKLANGLAERDYYAVNKTATIMLAKTAAKVRPDVYFIFLSSISVYGEGENNNKMKETNDCQPSTPYAKSKLKAENGLVRMRNNGHLDKLDILRLAPVYDRHWGLNLEKRVFAPHKICYLKFGSGDQKISLLSLHNLISFISYRLDNQELNNWGNIYNLTDKRDYSFNEIIEIFKKSSYQPNRITITTPLGVVRLGTRILARFFPKKADWILSCYTKLAFSLVFDNNKMLGTGFIPRHSLETILLEK